MKKLQLMFILCLSGMLNVVSAHDFSAENSDGVTIYYKKVNNTVVVTHKGDNYSDQKSYSGHVNIPPSVFNGGTVYFIYTVDENAFRGCDGLTGVTIPDAITRIGNSAFRDCSSLTSVIIPNSVRHIESDAFRDCTGLKYISIIDGINNLTTSGSIFQGCTSLESISIPNSLTSMGGSVFADCTSLKTATLYCPVIGYWIFDGCTGLETVTFGEYTNTINSDAFQGCTSLKEFIVDEENSYFSTIDGVLFNKDKTVLYCYPRARTLPYTIPDGVTSVGQEAFKDCRGLTNIEIPASMTSSINYNMFEGCTSLQSFVVSAQNPNYATIDGVLCNKDKTILVLYPNAKSSSYTIPASITELERYAFSKCTNLKSVVIPNDVIWGETVFNNCTNLTDVTLGSDLLSIGVCAFYYCKGLKNIIIPDKVTSIGNAAFQGCTSLSNVVIGKEVATIGSYAFYGCTGLKEVHSLNSVPPVVDTSAPFWLVDMQTCKLYVPEGSLDTYKTAEVWEDFTNIIEEEYTTGIQHSQTVHNIYISKSILYINSTVTEVVSVYSLSGQLLLSAQKPAGEVQFDLQGIRDRIVIVGGSSGWRTKLIVTN